MSGCSACRWSATGTRSRWVGRSPPGPPGSRHRPAPERGPGDNDPDRDEHGADERPARVAAHDAAGQRARTLADPHETDGDDDPGDDPADAHAILPMAC